MSGSYRALISGRHDLLRLVMLEERSCSGFALRYLDLGTREASDLLRREGIAALGIPAVTPDEEWIVYTETPGRQSELVLVDNFRSQS